ncbi:MAG: hypothetical protein DPW18_08045 [Chloroflexi bacterium]|nr:hypothetical protein [Chloroflexota bacterium]MDL1942816.1 hypothetical protein [Chloroflexi bacterium CFX2]
MAVSLDLVSGVLSFLFTVLILSYLIGDNPLFRVAVYVFVGAASGYIGSVIWWQALKPRLWDKLLSAVFSGSLADQILVLIPLIGAALILMKISPRMAGFARPSMAFLVGAGAAVTLGGALLGTLIPQVQATINIFDPQAAAARNIGAAEVLGNGAVVLFGTVASLAYFHFGAQQKSDGSMRRFGLIEIVAWFGRIFIGITLGAVFAGVYAAALTALIERFSSLVNFITLLRTTLGF